MRIPRMSPAALLFPVLTITGVSACAPDSTGKGSMPTISASVEQPTVGQVALTAYTLNKPVFSAGAIQTTFSPKTIVFQSSGGADAFAGWSGKTTIKYPSPKPDTGNGGIIQVFVLTTNGFEVIGSIDADNSSLEVFEFPVGATIELRAYAQPGYKFLRYDGVPGALEERSVAFYRLVWGTPYGDIRGWFQELSPGGSGGGGGTGGGSGCPNGEIIC